MKLLLSNDVNEVSVKQLAKRLERMKLQVVLNKENDHHTISIVAGIDKNTDTELFLSLPGVEKIIPFHHKYKLAGREHKSQRTVITVNDISIGDGNLTVMAGPCSIESREQVFKIAEAVSKMGATILRGGAFKPRTSPYDFQGLGEEGLRYLSEAATEHNLLSVSEVMDTQDVDLLAKYVDILQIGARNMQNYSLLKQAARAGKPIFLKRGFSSTYNDLLLAAEYILSEGNPNVILCERGIRTFETYSRNTMDIAAVPILKELSHLPIIVDPSHGTGIRNMVKPMACAAVAAGADGIMVEVHYEPDKAMSDAKQTIDFHMFSDMMLTLDRVKQAIEQ